MSHPSPYQIDIMAAYLRGYVEEGQLTSIRLQQAVDALKPVTPADTTVDGMIVSRILRRLSFRRSYLPQDRGTIIYRKAD